MTESIKQILMQRDNLTEAIAEELITDTRESLQDYLDNNDQDVAENICDEYFGLEPDHLDELI